MKEHPRSSTGQALVEFALVLPVFLMLLFGLIDGGRYVFMNNVLSQAAREGARVAAAEASWIGKTTANDPSCVGSEALITAANPGAHVCPAAVTGATNSLQADIIAAANRMVAPFGALTSATVYFYCQPVSTAPPANWTNKACPAADRTAAKNAAWVRVEMTFQPITPLVQAWTPTTSASATMVIN
jgi:Flp pilus assembly protein TadG